MELMPSIAANTLLPETWDPTVDPTHVARLRRYAQDALRRAVEAPPGPARMFAAERAWRSLRQQWAAAPRPEARPNPYRQAAQARLLAMLGPALAKNSAAVATTDLLAMLPRTSNYLTRQALARALTGLAPPLADDRNVHVARAAARRCSPHGSGEEAAAWATAGGSAPAGRIPRRDRRDRRSAPGPDRDRRADRHPGSTLREQLGRTGRRPRAGRRPM